MKHVTQMTRTALSLASFWMKAGPATDRRPESLVNLTFSHTAVIPYQVRSELVEFAYFVQEQRPKTVLEIGTRSGGTFFLLCRLSDPGATVVSLDLPGGRWGGGYGTYRIPIIHRMRQPGQRLHLLRGDSHHPAMRDRLTKVLGGRPIDLLFIDGDHSYGGVKQDFEMYSPLVRPGGAIAFHDIVPHPHAPDIEVDRFWNEIKHRYSHREIIEDRRQGWGGIGILSV